MPRFTGKTTAPAASSSVDADGAPVDTCLVIARSKAEPHRNGQATRIPFGERRYVGRGDHEPEKFAHFLFERPGEIPAVDPHEEILAGDSISKRQLEIRCTGHELELKKLGRCPTYVNGVEVDAATIRPGDTVRLGDEVLLLCVLRPRKLPLPPGLRALHAFGEACPIGMVGESAAAWEVRRQVAVAAARDEHTLVRGDSGVGKERVARAIHEQSRRARHKLAATNAADLSPALIASELFGNLKGYPSPEMEAREGLVGESDGGTLYFDEVGDLPLHAQAQLLRVMEEGECRPVGASKSRRVDLRVVGATNKDDSAFRADFLARFRLRVRVPPLAERREDIPLIVRHLILKWFREEPEPGPVARFIETMPDGRLEPRISMRFVDHLVRSPLPTNVRELEGILLRAIAESPGDKLRRPAERSRPELPKPKVAASGKPAGAARPSKEEIEASLAQGDWNVAQTAKARGMTRGALYRLMREYGIKRDEEEDE